MAFTRAIQNIVYGISSIPAIVRPEGFSQDQVNWFNDPTRGMVRRSSARLTTGYVEATDLGKILEVATVNDESVDRTYVLSLNVALTQLQVREWSDVIGDAIVSQAFPLNWLSTHDYGLFFIEKKLYIVNRDLDVEAESYIDMAGANTTSTIVIPQAIGYAETISATVKWAGPSANQVTLIAQKSYTSIAYDGNNQAAADASRARDTARTALALALRVAYTSPFGNGSQTMRVLELNGSIEVLMSTADVNDARYDASKKDFAMTIEVESSNLGFTYTTTDSIDAFNYVIRNTLGLPKYASQHGIKKVQADPRSDLGAYYLAPVSIVGTTNKDLMLEVSWVETVAPAERSRFTTSTLPLVFDTEAETMAHMVLKERPAGDDLSNKTPMFVDYKIKALVGTQERLGIIARDKMWFSRTDEVEQMWRTSAVQVLSTDAFGIGNAGNSTYFEHVTTHNKSLLVVSPESQVKLDGEAALTLGASLPITTSSTIDTSVKPISLGNRVYLPTRVANSAGILEYKTVNSTGVDDVESITEHVKGVLRGNIVALFGSDSSDLIVVQTDGMEVGELAICNINKTNPDQTIYAWSKWQLPPVDIVHVVVREDSVRVVCSRIIDTTTVYGLLDVDIYYNPFNVESRVCLDNQIEWTATTDDEVFTPPAYYPTDDLKIIPIDGATPLITEPIVVLGNGDIELHAQAGVTYLIGTRYESLLTLSTIYQYDRDGVPITQDRLRVLHLIVAMDDMYRLFRRIEAKYHDIEDEWMVCESQSNMETLYELDPFTGEYRYGVAMNSTDCNLILGTDYELAGTITGISYRGNLIRTG